MDYSRIELKTESAVAAVALNRPEVRNAFDESLISELTDCITGLCEDESIRAVILSGAGASFCAGADLAWMQRIAGYSRMENIADAGNLYRMLGAIYGCPKPTIAKVHGAAIGGGAGLVAACDIAIAAADAVFAFSEVRLGIAPAVIAPYVIQKIGVGAARALFVTGERFSASEALRIGLVHEVVPAAELEDAVESKVQAVLKCGPNAIAATKHLLREIAGCTPSEAAETTIECIADLRVSPEGQEGIQAFLEKRKTEFGSLGR